MGYKEKKPTADKIYATMKDFLPEGELRHAFHIARETRTMLLLFSMRMLGLQRRER